MRGVVALVNNLIWLFKGTELPQQCSTAPSGELIQCNQILVIFGSGFICGFLVWPLLDILIIFRFAWQRAINRICFKLGQPDPGIVVASESVSSAAVVSEAAASLTPGESPLALRRRGAVLDGAQ